MPNSEQLIKEHLDAIPKELRWAAEQDVSGLHEFFMNEMQRPLVACGMGGAYSSCVYASLLYGTYSGLGRAMTCYSVNSLSDKTLLNSKVLINSIGGHNDDVTQVADRLVSLKHPFAANLTMFDGNNNKLKGKIGKLCPSYSINLDGSGRFYERKSFVDINPAVSNHALYYKAFTRKTDFLNIDLSKRYTYTSNSKEAEVPSLGQIKHFVVLYGSYAEPVAYDFESLMVESGFASAQLADYRNFTHGRFSFVGNNIQTAKTSHESGDTAVIMLISPREKEIAGRYRRISTNAAYKAKDQVLPDWTPIITIETEYDNPLATIDLLYQTKALYLDISLARGTKDIDNPVCRNIDKRAPRGKILFKSEFKKFGPLTANQE